MSKRYSLPTVTSNLHPNEGRFSLVNPLKDSIYPLNTLENLRPRSKMSKRYSLTPATSNLHLDTVPLDLRSMFNRQNIAVFPEVPDKERNISNMLYENKNASYVQSLRYMDKLGDRGAICKALPPIKRTYGGTCSPVPPIRNKYDCNVRNVVPSITSNYPVKKGNTLSCVYQLKYKRALENLALSMRLTEQSRAKIIWRKGQFSSDPFSPTAKPNQHKRQRGVLDVQQASRDAELAHCRVQLLEYTAQIQQSRGVMYNSRRSSF